MIQIKLLKDWKSKKKGDIINISKKGAEQFVEVGAAEYLDVKKEQKKGVHKFMAENYFDDAKYNEEEDIIEIGKKEQEEDKTYNFEKAISFFSDHRHLAEQFIKIQPVYYDKSKLWWLWNFKEFRWDLVDETEILNLISKSSNANTISSQGKSEILEALRQIGRENKPIEIKKTWIQFKDEIWDVETGEHFKATPEYFVVNPIPWKLNGNPEAKTIDKLFEDWVGKKYKRLLYEIIGYCLLPDYPLHRIFCFIGEGMNGKTTFLNLLTNFLGKTNITSSDLDILLKSRFEVSKLYKKLACIMGETNFSSMEKTSTLKRLSGNDNIGFEFKNKNPFEDLNYAKIIIATNNLPSTTDKTIGFYRRWVIIPFINQFRKEENILNKIPEEEYESLATISFLALKDILTTRKFTNEGTIEERMERYESYSNFLEEFIQLFTEEDPNGNITIRDFYNKFIDWSRERKLRILSDRSLSKEMKKLGFNQERVFFDWFNDGKGGTIRCWVGLKWKE